MNRILVVDDAQFMRGRLSKLLTGHGYDVTEAKNGEQAVAVYRSVSPDAVLMDIALAEKDGLEALAKIRGIDPRAKVIMLTALGQESMVIKAIQKGAKDYVVKPFSPDRVIVILQKLLE